MSTSQNSLFRFAELAMFRLIGAYRIGWLLDRSGMRRGKEKAKTAKTWPSPSLRSRTWSVSIWVKSRSTSRTIGGMH